jgi:uncharacterized membrane protein YgdD (TMEM256/DUF423 family)
MLQRLLVFSGGLAGAAGVGLSAMAAHAGGGNLATVAPMLLMHAGPLLAIGLSGSAAMRRPAVAVLGGVLLFSGDLLARDFMGARIFPMAAPIGGSLMILGWLGVAVIGLLPRRGEVG